MSHHQHGVCVMVIVLGVLCNFALNLENNESRLVQIPREEFIRVMSNIISGGDNTMSSTVDVSTTDEEGFYDPMDPSGEGNFLPTFRSASTNRSSVIGETPRTAATKQAQQARASAASGVYYGNNGQANVIKRNRRVKSDSLYFLQRSMESRESAYRSGQSTYRTDEGDESDHHLPVNNNA